ncbi:MAG: hypothetical protein HN867_03700 [Deltaproteobacteria bacterium]|nr:hypothetical protein [Deltaproteobacteria bacterium]
MKSLMSRVFISLASPIICFGCSTTDNWAIHPLYEHVEENSLQLQKILADTYRKDSIYRDYNTKMIAAGLFRSEEYRQFLIDFIQSSYQLDETASLEISLDQKQQFANQFEFLLIIYSGSNEKTDFGKKDSIWQARLYDDDGDKVVPTGIQKLKNTDKERVLLGSYLKELDRWVEVYNLSFPKLNKSTTGVKLGSAPFRLEIASIEGRLEFNWEDAQKFY